MAGDGHVENALLLKLATGGLDGARLHEAQRHLATCPKCRDVLASLSEETSPQGRPLGTGEVERTRASDPLVGRMLGEYRVVERLGQGGMGIVYRGEQPVIGKAVAIKVLLPQIADDRDVVERMIREAQAVNAIRHPNIVDIFSFGTLPDGRPYLVMELLSGQSLAAHLAAQGPLPVPQAITVLKQTAGALAAAHAAGVIHRDLKADNLYVDRTPDGWRVTLLDFGLAKRAGPQNHGLTAPGARMGTPAYMAPEQVKGLEVTPKTDAYALGILAYAVLTGREPFLEGTILDVMEHHLKKPVPRVPNVPPALADLVAELVEKDPVRRPDADQVAQRLAAIGRAAPGPSKSSRWATALALAAMVLAGTSLAGLGWWINREEAAPPLLPPALLVPEPIPAPPTAPMEVVEVAPPPTPRIQPGWPCAKIRDVGKVHLLSGGGWSVFIVTIENESALIVTSGADKKAMKKMEQLRRAILACPKSGGRLEAKSIDDAKLAITDLGIWRGIGVEAPALEVIPGK